MKLLYPQEYSNRMFKTSFLGFFASCWAYILGHEFLSCLALAVTICSLNHWRYPLKDSWRRVVDIVIANTSLLYHVYLAFHIQSALVNLVFLLWFIAACCYVTAVSWGLSAARGTAVAYNRGSIYHCGLHICATCGNALFYYLL